MATSQTVGLAALSEREQRTLTSTHPALSRGEAAVAISGPRAVTRAVEAFARQLADQARQGDAILAALSGEDSAVLDEDRLLQLRLHAKARNEFTHRYAFVSSAELASVRGSTARNGAALANRWKREKRVFAIRLGRADSFPTFQLDEHGEPLPAVREILRALSGMSTWSVALWFGSRSEWLEGRRPADVLGEHPEAVIDAARNFSEPLDI